MQFTDWLYSVYNLQEISTKVFVVLDRVYKGKYKHYSKPIEVYDLWDAWYRKLPQLREFHLTPFFQHKNLSDIETLLYDLGIIVKQWDQYLDWQKNHPQEVEDAKEKRKKEVKIDYNKLNCKKQIQSNNSDLNSIMTDIWGGDSNG